MEYLQCKQVLMILLEPLCFLCSSNTSLSFRKVVNYIDGRPLFRKVLFGNNDLIHGRIELQ